MYYTYVGIMRRVVYLCWIAIKDLNFCKVTNTKSEFYAVLLILEEDRSCTMNLDAVVFNF